jgi:hypothetical protein
VRIARGRFISGWIARFVNLDFSIRIIVGDTSHAAGGGARFARS